MPAHRDEDFLLPWPDPTEPGPDPAATAGEDESAADDGPVWSQSESERRPNPQADVGREPVLTPERTTPAARPRLVLRLRRGRDELN